jgi:hypothetical protein
MDKDNLRDYKNYPKLKIEPIDRVKKESNPFRDTPENSSYVGSNEGPMENKPPQTLLNQKKREID